jgi:hypothetical protein
MQQFAKIIIVSLTTLIGLILTIFYIVKDSDPTIKIELNNSNQFIKIADLNSNGDKKGSFKLALSFQLTDSVNRESFIGVKINTQNDNIDALKVGIKNQRSLILEILKDKKILEVHKKNIKLPLNKSLNLFATYQSNQKDVVKTNENTLSLRVCEGIGFFVDFANLRIKLNNHTETFQPYSIETVNSDSNLSFSKTSLSIWKDYESFD